MDISKIIQRAKKVRPVYYWTAAFLIHIIFVAITGPRFVFHGLPIKAKLATTIVERERILPKRIAPRELSPEERRLRPDAVPTHIIKKAPEVQKRIMIKKAMEVPAYTKPPSAVRPGRVDLSQDKGMELLGDKVEKTDTLIPRRRAERRVAITKFKRQFRVEGSKRAIKAIFTPYQLSYLEGDWNCDPTSIPNLMTEINRRTNMRADIKPKVVRAGSRELLRIGAKALFVYMTGHRNFHFTEREVKNLRKYLLKGGAIWADNCFPGRRSRFDIAFRREMKRVMPDRNFETISLEHPIFKNFYLFTEVPRAMNYRNDPVEVIKIDRREAVIYTLNDYGCLWETAFDEQGKVFLGWDEKWGRTYGPHWLNRHFTFENVEQASIDRAYQLGINIVVYLLERGR